MHKTRESFIALWSDYRDWTIVWLTHELHPYFEQLRGQIYPTELQLNKANSSDTEAPFLDLNLSITNGIVSPKIGINGMILILK